MTRTVRRIAVATAVAAFAVGVAGAADAATTSTTFTMVRSSAAKTAGCLAGAKATVTIHSVGPVEVMTVKARHLPSDAEFDLFVTQVPDAPFGLSWYQGDLETDSDGRGTGRFVGRFSRETFSVAPDVAPAPVLHAGDAASNPATAPVHQLHLGLWFNDPADAARAGCPTKVTPFNGDHTAGIQALSTRTSAPDSGPLGLVRP